MNSLVVESALVSASNCSGVLLLFNTFLEFLDLLLEQLSEEATKFIKGLPEFEGVAEQSAIADYLDRKDEKPAKAKAPAKAPKAKATAKVAVDAELEDAPF